MKKTLSKRCDFTTVFVQDEKKSDWRMVKYSRSIYKKAVYVAAKPYNVGNKQMLFYMTLLHGQRQVVHERLLVHFRSTDAMEASRVIHYLINN